MDDLFASIGRKQVELDAMHEAYNALLGVLAEVASGAIMPARVTVDRAARTWAVAPQPDIFPVRVISDEELHGSEKSVA